MSQAPSLSALAAYGRVERLYIQSLMKLFRFSRPISVVEFRRLADSPEFKGASRQVASRMVSQVLKENANGWREAAMRSNYSNAIFTLLRKELSDTTTQRAIRAIIASNAKLIRSIPTVVARQVSRYAEEAFEQGKRSKEVEREIRSRMAGMTASRIRLIARTEVAKAETAVTRTRGEQIGINWGVWEASHDERVRKSHRNLDGVLVAFKDPPAPEKLIGERSSLGAGLPGEFPNCRCILLPLISLDEIAWPARVHMNNKIVVMSRPKFAKIAGYDLPVAA